MAAELNIDPQGVVVNPSFVQGETWSIQFTWKMDNTAVDLTNYTARMQIRNARYGAPLLSLTNGSGITLGGAAGTIIVALTATQTAALPTGALLYDLELVHSSGVVTNLVRGKMTVIRNITT